MTRGGASASISQEAAVQGAASLERRLKPREQRVQAVHCPAVEMPRKEGGGGGFAASCFGPVVGWAASS